MGSPTPPRRSGLPLFVIVAILVGVLVVVAALTGYFVLRPSSPAGNASGSTPEYPTTFDETGLPGGTPWSVTIDGANHTSSNGSIALRLPAGTYPYTVAPVPGYAAPKGATVTVAAPSAEVMLAFTVFEFSVTFDETGLPSGTLWSVEIGGSQPSSSVGQLTVAEPNGSYPFSVGPPANYTATPSSGTVLVQGRDVSESISFTQNSTPPTQSTIILGGSTSVYPFANLAASWFAQNFSNVAISVSQGGDAAGLLAVCAGQIDVGMAAIPVTVAALESTYGCPSSDATTITIATVAYDAVDVVVAASNPHGLLSLNFDTLNLIYEHASTTTGYATISTLNGAPLPSGFPAAGSGPLEWGQLPAAVAGASVGSLGTEELESEGAGAGGAPCDAPFADDVCAATFGTTTTPCGWSICAGGNATEPATNIVHAFARSDTSGATEAFEARLLGLTSATTWASNYSGLGWTGCGSTNGYLPGCNITVPVPDTATGAPGLLAAVSSDPNAIGYAPDGLARATAGIGVAGIVPFLADGEGIGNGLAANNSTGLAYGGVVPSVGAKGTIEAAIQNLSTVNQYVGWRPFDFVTLTPPTGELSKFYVFLTEPAINSNLAYYSDEVSIYSV